MIKIQKIYFLFLAVSLWINPTFAANSSTASPITGLPASATTSTSETVGELPYTTQWVSEKINSYLYLSYNTAQLGNQTLTVNQYISDYGSTKFAFLGVDYFSKLFSFAGAESSSIFKDIGLWGRYSLGAANRRATLTSTGTPINSAVESNSLLILNARIAVLLGYDYLSWVKPYAGFEIDPYFYRNTADISGAEQQGENFHYGSIVGAHFPIFFSGRGSILAEFRKLTAARGSGQIFSGSTDYTAGLGVTF